MQIACLMCKLMLLQYHALQAQNIGFVMFAYNKRLVVMFWTRVLTTLAHKYKLVGWLKM